MKANIQDTLSSVVRQLLQWNTIFLQSSCGMNEHASGEYFVPRAIECWKYLHSIKGSPHYVALRQEYEDAVEIESTLGLGQGPTWNFQQRDPKFKTTVAEQRLWLLLPLERWSMLMASYFDGIESF